MTITITESTMYYNLRETRIYTYSDFKKILLNHGLPNSDPWIRKMEALGYIPAPRLPSSVNTKSRKIYTGRQIQDTIQNLISIIENGKTEKAHLVK